jgi:hypothetical protein
MQTPHVAMLMLGMLPLDSMSSGPRRYYSSTPPSPEEIRKRDKRDKRKQMSKASRKRNRGR